MLSVKYAVLSDQGKVHDSSKCKIHSEECIVKTAWFLLEVCIFDFSTSIKYVVENEGSQK